MNKTDAKILIMCENLDKTLAYAEYIAAKLEKSYNKISLSLRTMQHKGYIKLTKYKNKRIVTHVSESALVEARQVIENGTR